MELIEILRDGVMTIEPRGRIGAVEAKPFGERITELIRSGSSHLLIDLRDTLYISSAGFRSLLHARKLAEELQRKLVLCGMSAEVRRLFEIGAFTELFVICATRDEGMLKAK